MVASAGRGCPQGAFAGKVKVSFAEVTHSLQKRSERICPFGEGTAGEGTAQAKAQRHVTGGHVLGSFSRV